jgi:hypothetical protein
MFFQPNICIVDAHDIFKVGKTPSIRNETRIDNFTNKHDWNIEARFHIFEIR